MKSRFWFYCALAVCVILAVLALWMRPGRHKSNANAKNPIVQPANPSTNTMAVSQIAHVSKHSNKVLGAPKSSGTAQTNLQSLGEGRAEMVKRALEHMNVPVNFYGQVIDQDSNGLAGVKIRVYIRHWELTGNALSAPVYLTKETGADGHFEITGETGDGFTIEAIQKDGYKAEPGPRSFGAHGGSFENPVVFKMWNDNIHEKLITGGKAFPIVPDGRPYLIDLAKDTISESGGGDLKIWVRYPAQVTRGQLYNWSCEIDVINGGLLEESNLDSAMYVAPAEGYIPTFQFQQQIKGGQSGSIGKRRFYLNLNNGREEYGRMTVDLIAPYNDQVTGLIRLSYAINPSGSRILR